MKFTSTVIAAASLLGFALASEHVAVRSTKKQACDNVPTLDSCFLINLSDKNEIIMKLQVTAPTVYTATSRYSIYCTTTTSGTKNLDYVKFTNRDGSIQQTEYKAPWFLKGDHNGWINPVDYLSKPCGAMKQFEVKGYVWGQSNEPCFGETFELFAKCPGDTDNTGSTAVPSKSNGINMTTSSSPTGKSLSNEPTLSPTIQTTSGASKAPMPAPDAAAVPTTAPLAFTMAPVTSVPVVAPVTSAPLVPPVTSYPVPTPVTSAPVVVSSSPAAPTTTTTAPQILPRGQPSDSPSSFISSSQDPTLSPSIKATSLTPSWSGTSETPNATPITSSSPSPTTMTTTAIPSVHSSGRFPSSIPRSDTNLPSSTGPSYYPQTSDIYEQWGVQLAIAYEIPGLTEISEPELARLREVTQNHLYGLLSRIEYYTVSDLECYYLYIVDFYLSVIEITFNLGQPEERFNLHAKFSLYTFWSYPEGCTLPEMMLKAAIETQPPDAYTAALAGASVLTNLRDVYWFALE